MTKGQSVPTEISSTYDRTLQVVLGGSFYGTYDAATNITSFSYPIGSLIPLGVTGQISQIDIAWLYFPYLAFCIALSAGLIYSIASKFISNRYLAGVVSITSASASTLYAYALWGGIKEVVLVPILFYSLINFTNFSRANLLPIGISVAAIFAVGGTSGIGFILGQIILIVIFRFFKKNEERITKRWILIGVAIILAFLLISRIAISILNKYLIPEMPDSGNLGRPLSLWQVFGIWPSGDFRGDIYWQPYSFIFLTLIGIVTLFGVWKSYLNNQLLLTVGFLTPIAIVIYSELFSGIWLTGKAIAVASPFVLLLTFYGIYQLIGFEKVRVLGMIFLASVLIGVSTANYLGFRHSWLAPSEKIKELQKIGKEFAGEGPTLMTDYAVLAARYFLRDMKTESASELRVNLIPMRDGTELKKGFSADIDLFDNSEISKYQMLVLRHSATSSRPLFNYDLVFKGEFYDVWRKNQTKDKKIKSIPLGNNYAPGEVPNCDSIKKKVTNVEGKIYAALRKPISISNLADGQIPKGWRIDEGNLGAVVPTSGGYLQAVVDLPETADYEWFLGGSYPGKLKIFLDREEIFTGRTYFEGNKFLNSYLFTSKVKAGKHLVEIRYSKPLFRAGAGATESMGPLYLSSQTASDSKILETTKDSYEKLCNKEIDWIAWVEK